MKNFIFSLIVKIMSTLLKMSLLKTFTEEFWASISPTISNWKDLKCVHSFYKWGLSAPKSISSEYHFLLRLLRFMYFSEYQLKSDSIYLTCLSCNFNIQPRLVYRVTCECIPHKHWRTKSYTFDITIVFIEIYWKNVIQIYTKQSPTRRFGFHIAFTWNIKYYIPDLI